MKKALIYYRVSTEDQAQNGVSLEQQKKACLDYANRHDMDVVKIFHDDGVSAKTINRKGLQDLLSHCSKHHKEIDNVIVYKIDRLSRNSNDYTTMYAMFTKMDVQLVSTVEQIDETPMGKFMGTFMAANAQLDNDLKSERVKSCMRERIKNGVWYNKAPIGYKNGRSEDGKKTIDVDSTKAKVITWCFEEFAKGIYTLEDIRHKANKKGLRTATGKEISAQTISKIINNTFYYGLMHSKAHDEYFQGTHIPIISEDTYFRCQEILSKKNGKSAYKTKKKNAEDFPLRRFVQCAFCGRPLTGAYSTGRHGGKFGYYKCYNRECKELSSVSQAKLEEIFLDYVESITPTKKSLATLKGVLMHTWDQRYKEIEEARKASEKALEKLSEEKRGLITMKSKELISDEDFKETMDDLKARTMKHQIASSTSHGEEFDMDKTVTEVFEKIVLLPSLWKNANYEKKLQLQGLIFVEKPTFDGKRIETPQLSLLLAKNKEPAEAGSRSVAIEELKWNTIEQAIVEFLEKARFLRVRGFV